MATGSKVIVACMRNEAIFLVEWLAHHLALGFDRIVVFTNDCDDGTDTLLRLLGQTGLVEHHDNPGPYEQGGTIQRHALHLAYQIPHVRAAGWLLHIDADEYLNITTGNRRIDDLIRLFPDVDGIAIMWRFFGSSGMTSWSGGSIVESFTWCEDRLPDADAGETTGFKTLFRPDRFNAMSVHHPKFPKNGMTPKVVNTAGVAMPDATLLSRLGSGYRTGTHQHSWENACLHHHHVKSDDLHRLKHGRGDANGRQNAKRKIGSAYYHYANRNEGGSTSLVDLRPRVRPWEERLRSVPGVADVEAAAWAWFRSRYPA